MCSKSPQNKLPLQPSGAIMLKFPTHSAGQIPLSEITPTDPSVTKCLRLLTFPGVFPAIIYLLTEQSALEENRPKAGTGDISQGTKKAPRKHQELRPQGDATGIQVAGSSLPGVPGAPEAHQEQSINQEHQP